MQPLDKWLRRSLAYTTFSGLIVFIFFYGVGNESLPGMSKGFPPLNPVGQHQDLNSRTSPKYNRPFCLLHAENSRWSGRDSRFQSL